MRGSTADWIQVKLPSQHVACTNFSGIGAAKLPDDLGSLGPKRLPARLGVHLVEGAVSPENQRTSAPDPARGTRAGAT